MVLFPNAKINLGLNVTGKLSNGYHELETVMVPIGWCDILEIVPKTDGTKTELHCLGRPVACEPQKNLVIKAYNMLSDKLGGLPPVDIYLNKIIPDGAGLGGGSSDAAYTLVGLNELFNLGKSREQLASIAAGIGADCPFFIYNKPMLATGIGTDFSPVSLPDFHGYIVVVKPPESVSTVEAYRNVKVERPELSLVNKFSRCSEVADFAKFGIENSFEGSVMPLIAEVGRIKDLLYQEGAVYASMSGSGSAVYGLFDSDNLADNAVRCLSDYYVYMGEISF